MRGGKTKRMKGRVRDMDRTKGARTGTARQAWAVTKNAGMEIKYWQDALCESGSSVVAAQVAHVLLSELTPLGLRSRAALARITMRPSDDTFMNTDTKTTYHFCVLAAALDDEDALELALVVTWTSTEAATAALTVVAAA